MGAGWPGAKLLPCKDKGIGQPPQRAWKAGPAPHHRPNPSGPGGQRIEQKDWLKLKVWT